MFFLPAFLGVWNNERSVTMKESVEPLLLYIQIYVPPCHVFYFYLFLSFLSLVMLKAKSNEYITIFD